MKHYLKFPVIQPFFSLYICRVTYMCFTNKSTTCSFLLIQISFGTFYSDDGHVDINAMYEGKAFIETDVTKKESKLLLKHVTLRERRLIRCFVQIPGDTEGQTSALTSLVVLGKNVLIISVVIYNS